LIEDQHQHVEEEQYESNHPRKGVEQQGGAPELKECAFWFLRSLIFLTSKLALPTLHTNSPMLLITALLLPVNKTPQPQFAWLAAL
jgi:hypothetical protein